jgi:signal transduction histidine kinase
MIDGNATLGSSAWEQGLRPVGETLSERRLGELLGEVQNRIQAIVGSTRDRMDALLKSVLAVSSGLDLDTTLRQIVQAAIDLVDARYGALGVFGEEGKLSQFVYVGIDGVGEQTGALRTGVLDVATNSEISLVDGLAAIEEAKGLLLDDLSMNPESAGFLPNESPTRRFLGVPVWARGEVFGRLYLTEKHSGEGFTEDDEIVVRALAGAAGIAIDNSRLYETARRRRRWLEATAEVTTKLLGGSDTREALHLIARHARELTGADYTLIALPDDVERPTRKVAVLTVAVCVGMGADTITGTTMPIAGSTAGAVFADHVTQNVDGLAYDLTKGLGIEFGPALALPLGAGDPPAGVLLTLRRPGSPPFDELEQQMVSLFANQAMLALERAEIQKARRELELLADRDRIARDLHDHVIQRLFAVGLAMESTLGLVKTPSITDRLSDHVDQVYEVIQEIRTAIFDLQTGPDDGSQLRTVLHQVITDLTADSPIRTTVRMSGPLDSIGPRFSQHLEAAVRESVSNAVRHSRATTLMITISADDDVVVDVTDDGIGMPVTVGRSGLHNLRARAQAVGGTCTVSTPDVGGTRFIWTAPLT